MICYCKIFAKVITVLFIQKKLDYSYYLSNGFNIHFINISKNISLYLPYYCKKIREYISITDDSITISNNSIHFEYKNEIIQILYNSNINVVAIKIIEKID